VVEAPVAAEAAWALPEAATPVFSAPALPAEMAPGLEPLMAEEVRPEPVFDLAPEPEEPLAASAPELEPVHEAAPEAAPEAVHAAAQEPPAERVATATLGEIYLRQGHLGEAKRIFDEVLSREPDNAAARQGLAQLASRRGERRPLEGRDLLAGYEPGEEGGEMEAKARKVFLLNSYLKRLRRVGQRDVS
jgi:hypothetical protein